MYSYNVNDFLDNIDFNNSDFYVCGNPNMILEISKILLEKKVNIANIHFEIFEQKINRKLKR